MPIKWTLEMPVPIDKRPSICYTTGQTTAGLFGLISQADFERRAANNASAVFFERVL